MKKSNNKKYPVSGKPIPAFSYRTEPNYYKVFIGPVSRQELDEKFPNGEGGLRAAIQEAFYAAFGPEKECSSGWGCTPQQKQEASYALDDDDAKRSLILSYYYEKKPMPRALRAWELLFQEQEEEERLLELHAKDVVRRRKEAKEAKAFEKKEKIDKSKKLIKTKRT